MTKGKEGNPKRTLWKTIWVVSLALGLISSPGVPALAANGSPRADVQQLSSIVEKLIRIVEDSSLQCDTRNSVVGQLRVLDDALRSGRLSEAQLLAQAWRQHAWSLEAARVIGPELGSSIQNRLSRIRGKIDFGSPVKPGPTRHWKPLPSCESSTSSVESSSDFLVSASGDVVATYTPSGTLDPLGTLKIFLMNSLNLLNFAAPGVGTGLSTMVAVLWPAGTQPGAANMLQQIVDATVYGLVQNQVEGIGGVLGYTDGTTPGSWNDTVALWKTDCKKDGYDSILCISGARGLWGKWSGIHTNIFLAYRSSFQMQTSTTDYRVDLLPLFAQFENLYMAFLRDGIMLHEYWKDRRDLDPTWGDLDHDEAARAMGYELDPDFVESSGDHIGERRRGVGYVNSIYQMGLDQQPSGSANGWGTRNAYIRDNILQVLDFRDTWKYLDPRAYPNGVPGGLKLTRMIYSDPVGAPQHTPSLPSNVAGPLTELSVWTEPVPVLKYGATKAISAVQATGPPLWGPAQSGAITGGDQPINRVGYYDLSARGPIIKAQAATDKRICFGDACPMEPVWIGEEYATGATTGNGYLDPNANVHAFQYDGEVLATVQSISHYSWGGNSLTDSVVFGFRYANSFHPAGVGIGVASGKCIDLPSWTNGTQAVIHSCYNPPTPAQIWTYDANLQQISVTNPAEWSGTNPTQSGKHCLDTAGGGTARYTPVVISACDDGAVTYDENGDPVVSSQRWTIDAVGVDEVGGGIAKITNVKSGLVITVSYYRSTDGAGLWLEPYAGDAPQQWRAHSELTGEIHGIGSGRCVDVPNASTTAGTQVQIYDCNGTDAQQWTYDPMTEELIYAKAPSMCLEVRGWPAMLGTAVQINTCTGAAGQQWTLQGDGGTISNDKSGLVVMEAKGGNTGNGTLVQLNTPNGTPAQQWSRTSSRGGALHALGAGKCLDLREGWSNGTQAVIRSCDTPLSVEQSWTYHPIPQTFSVNSPSGPKCLDATGGGTAAGTAVVINDCTGAASQRWSRDFAHYTIINVNTITEDNKDGLVLDVAGGGTADGTPVQLSNQAEPIPLSEEWVWTLN